MGRWEHPEAGADNHLSSSIFNLLKVSSQASDEPGGGKVSKAVSANEIKGDWEWIVALSEKETGDWPVAGFGGDRVGFFWVEPSEWEGNTSRTPRSTFCPLSFPASSLCVKLFTCSAHHTPRTKRERLAFMNWNEGFWVAIGSSQRH